VGEAPFPAQRARRATYADEGLTPRRPIPLPVVHTWAFAWSNRSWLRPRSFGVRETTWVCLASLRTIPPATLPKLNKKRALFVLTKIDVGAAE
jgi:hypothetical protein